MVIHLKNYHKIPGFNCKLNDRSGGIQVNSFKYFQIIFKSNPFKLFCLPRGYYSRIFPGGGLGFPLWPPKVYKLWKSLGQHIKPHIS
jgi:hypothetical protein